MGIEDDQQADPQHQQDKEHSQAIQTKGQIKSDLGQPGMKKDRRPAVKGIEDGNERGQQARPGHEGSQQRRRNAAYPGQRQRREQRSQ